MATSIADRQPELSGGCILCRVAPGEPKCSCPPCYCIWCLYRQGEFCPDEGCPKHLGCARDQGWKPGQPTPREYQGLPSPALDS